MLFDILVIVSAVAAGIGAGIFWAFSTGVMPGLRRASDAAYVETMRGINLAVITPAFLLPIFAPPVLLGAAAAAAFVTGSVAAGWLLVAGGVLFLIGGVLLTGARNVPLNNALKASRADDPVVVRAAFDRPWRAANHVRTVLTFAGFVLAVVAAVVG